MTKYRVTSKGAVITVLTNNDSYDILLSEGIILSYDGENLLFIGSLCSDRLDWHINRGSLEKINT